uniref:Bidirectional sugar transporter SWEET n=1 Tax=Ananas comosus var. bracteatus TaxID=296719 RepID=A0A6V7Q7S2_ANACO|nr:unnamed protein product [Ananas comosus var. bracteatus]
MAALDHPWAFAFGLLGNLISFVVYLAPIPTFCRVYRAKSTQGFQSVPYVVALFSAMLWIYYALVNTHATLLITINSFGCMIESIYIIMYLVYAPRKAKIQTFGLIFLFNVVVFSLIILFTLLLATGSNRVKLLGWICVVFSVSVFVAPLSIIRLVIQTRSVEYMPFYLSFFLTISAIIWFLYGFLTKDLYVQLPNVLGFTFGFVQMALYWYYKRLKKAVVSPALPDDVVTIVTLSPIPVLEVHRIESDSSEVPNEIADGKTEEAKEANNEESPV